MRRNLLLAASSIMIMCALTVAAFGQGRGRGIGLGRKSDVFVNSHDARTGRLDGLGPNSSWKCGKFVNCHDARDGRWDGRGPRVSRDLFRNDISVARGSRVRHRMNRNFDRDEFRRSARLNRLEMLRQERIAERRYFARRRR